jgi:hypothetical protein
VVPTPSAWSFVVISVVDADRRVRLVFATKYPS